MGKIIGAVLLIGSALVFLNRQKIEEYKQKIIEVINPAAKERRLLGELETNLDQLDSSLTNLAVGGKSLVEAESDQKKLNTAIANARSTLQELKETNKKNDLGASVSSLIQKIIPLSSKPSPTWLPPGQECPRP